jgi:CobQ-like glutamine amidotransferase family enzyme
VTDLLRIAVVYPDLLGTYGDGGNGLILARRAEWRGVEVVLTQAASDAALPEADIYCLGGGEDGPQVRAARSLIEDGTLARRVADGAVVLAVCAGYQIVGKSFPGADGTLHEGVGLLDITTTKGSGPRAVGEVVGEPTDEVPGELPTLTGFENHGGQTALGDRVTALALVTHGVGNGDGSGTEGALSGRVVGTYLHGPVLARNPALADLLLHWALGTDVDAPSGVGAAGAAEISLFAPSDSAAGALREERLSAAGGRDRRGLRRHRRAGDSS